MYSQDTYSIKTKMPCKHSTLHGYILVHDIFDRHGEQDANMYMEEVLRSRGISVATPNLSCKIKSQTVLAEHQYRLHDMIYQILKEEPQHCRCLRNLNHPSSHESDVNRKQHDVAGSLGLEHFLREYWYIADRHTLDPGMHVIERAQMDLASQSTQRMLHI